MPIILDDLEKTLKSAPKSEMPSFFSKSLTGSGKKTGPLNQNLLPKRAGAKNAMPPFSCRGVHTTISSGTADYEFIPMTPMPFGSAVHGITKMPDDAVPVSKTDDLWCFVTMEDTVLQTENVQDQSKTKTLYPRYTIALFDEDGKAEDGSPLYRARLYSEYVLNENQFTSEDKRLDVGLLKDYFDKLTVFEVASSAVSMWTEHLPELTRVFIENGADLHGIEELAARLNDYPVALDDYWKIYDIIAKGAPDALKAACGKNLNLLLNDTLKDLEAKKPQIPSFTPTTYTCGPIKPSYEQEKAILTDSPAVIVQAGAGTGKSWVIQNRLEYMKQCGVDMNKVMVLSFTNAAADHIHEIAPDVNSKTIASMIHDIYALNWNHALSTIDTILNILYAKKQLKGNDVAKELIVGLKTLKKDVNTGLMMLSGTIEKNFDEVIRILDLVNQTTLELESLICYHAGAGIKEPISDCTHVIMDEVQDNSIFEFIYIIRYIIRHNACLYLVGDCSQTLYEFRASNPKALNCLEMSGVFDCFQLQTNYRSNQNILDFANLTLANIEANQFAKIRLRANSFLTRDFAEDVRVDYTRLAKQSDLRECLPSMIAANQDWIRERIDKNEQVCFLAYRRKDLKPFEAYVAAVFPDKVLSNIVPEKSFAQSFFSKYINFLGEELYHRPGADVTGEISRHMIDNVGRIAFDYQIEQVQASLGKWAAKYGQMLMYKDIQLQSGTLTADQFKEEAFETLIEFEIDANAMKQYLTGLENQKIKAQDTSKSDFIVSTIHSAKGLEFDNVILLYDEAKSRNEEDKRMYYVGLTRAKKSECVLAYNTNVGSPIRTAFEALRDAKAASETQILKAAMADAVEIKAATPEPCGIEITVPNASGNDTGENAETPEERGDAV